MKSNIEYMRKYNNRQERTVECPVCHIVFNTYYQHKRCCSKECSKYFRSFMFHKEYKEKYPEKLKETNKNSHAKRYAKDRELHKVWAKNNVLKMKEYGKKDREKHPDREKNWYAKDPTKKKVLSHKIRLLIKGMGSDHLEMEKRLKMFDECCYCGSQRDLTIEHLVPISKGGTNASHNLYIACIKCNSSKQARNFFDWYKIQNFYDNRRELKILQMTLAG